ncbi:MULTISPECIES: DUF1109 domain-containing protein [unclassified Sphingomonas]|uniref:DUF1109 domain-containing protein n=1 Tax=unclassified Sphingomonas TaxID=196159 RepID=UPI0006FC1C07|nr:MULTISPECIES: DUF1109 domain-containing protein [unclassified Sphingomonas]KQX20710.1 hypothetical protein ASD17_07345 [Sphingomonas sp. Root1294]KQY68556.1 hypothetical protein ASD39_03865 [Sphingomonas sp. Root50]KRB87961.1 hypothetical protein ASE22_21040 [Sphingomonas sp. Root720]
MNTDALIRSLAENVKAVPRHAVGRRLALGIFAGAVVSLVAILSGLGIRPDLILAMQGSSFWVKWAYTASLGIGAIAMIARLARPDTVRLRWMWLIAVPIVLLAGLAALEMAHAPPAEWLAMWLGHSWKQCPWLVLMLSAPIFVGLLWSFRRLAPTRLRLAGATAGLAAGACAATLYCLHCPEVSAIFVLTWYTLGIGLAAAIGAILGPRLLRW